MKDRREHARARRTVRVVWNNQELAIESITRDICPKGAFIVAYHLPPPRSPVELELYFGEERYCCQGWVAWINKGQLETYPPGFGVEFKNVEPQLLERLWQSAEHEEE